MMVKLTPEMKEDIKKVRVLPLATASNDKTPNVIPIGIAEIIDTDDKDDYIHIMNNFFLKTIANIKENPKVALYIWSPETSGCIQIKGEVVEIAGKGTVYNEMTGRVAAAKPGLPMKEIIRIKITEIFNCKSGKEAGQRIL
ncbi:MAG: pyridoxamine 5'-phosphate oxidase family protein [Methanosarcinales archaeon]|jgi:predicted pyridoxine 5'-phosphate oxidase superfamily flavin-nucleotide-binding protein|nr:pyridoxamine 5'-phosphate oxidase family protein [Methanosarcinales archaeon]